MKVELTARARRDLFAIEEYIGEDNPWRAETFLEELRDVIRTVGIRPLSFPVWSPVFPEYRSARHGHYLILFRVFADVVRVEHVAHGARDIFRLLDDIE